MVMVTQGKDDEIGCGLQLRKSVHKLLFARSCWIFWVPLSSFKESVCVGIAETWCDLGSLLIVTEIRYGNNSS